MSAGQGQPPLPRRPGKEGSRRTFVQTSRIRSPSGFAACIGAPHSEQNRGRYPIGTAAAAAAARPRAGPRPGPARGLARGRARHAGSPSSKARSHGRARPATAATAAISRGPPLGPAAPRLRPLPPPHPSTPGPVPGTLARPGTAAASGGRSAERAGRASPRSTPFRAFHHQRQHQHRHRDVVGLSWNVLLLLRAAGLPAPGQLCLAANASARGGRKAGTKRSGESRASGMSRWRGPVGPSAVLHRRQTDQQTVNKC